MKWFVLSDHMYICSLLYYKQEDISTGTVGHKPLTISSIVSFDLMELRVSNMLRTRSFLVHNTYIVIQVPQQSKLLGYEQQALPLAGVYIPPDIPRGLRIGAKVFSLVL